MISAFLGIVILLFLIVDVFGTVFDVRGRGGFINKRHNRLIWSAFRRGVPDGRSGWLQMGAPFMVCLTLVGWVLLLNLGFALIYLPWMDTFIFVSGGLRNPWLEAIYYSGYIGATLGIGDVVPDVPIFRFIAPIQALAGFALVSISVTYLLATYSQIIPKRSVANQISGFLRANDFSEDGRDRADMEATDRWAQQVTGALATVLEAHFQYPVLHYFRSEENHAALPVQLDSLDRMREQKLPVDWSSRAALRGLSDALDEFAKRVDTHFVPSRFERSGDEDDHDSTSAAIDRLLRYLLYR